MVAHNNYRTYKGYGWKQGVVVSWYPQLICMLVLVSGFGGDLFGFVFCLFVGFIKEKKNKLLENLKFKKNYIRWKFQGEETAL